MRKKTKHEKKKADHYDDPKHNYLHYWDGRDYEHAAEEIALKRILKNKTFKTAIDIGGGYGRLSQLLSGYADSVYLLEPSKQQLDIAKEYLKDNDKVKQKQMQADDLHFDDKSIDLAIMVRVMHHLPDPSTELNEIFRVLDDDGLFILELANYAHARNRLKHFAKGEKLPLDPVDIRSPKNKKQDSVAFVNHNPKTVVKQLAHAGFKVESVLSVSNLRSQKLKKLLPRQLMLKAENILQPTLSRFYFGPSIFFIIKKAK